MTTVAVLADPPRAGLVLPEVTESGVLSDGEAAQLYTAMLRDVCLAVEESGGELLVNYRADEDLEEAGERDAESDVRAAVEPALSAPEEARFEVQVGSTRSARVGNTVTHLLEREEVATAAVVEPTAPFLSRGTIDTAAMKLRRSEVVLGPAPGGRVYYAGFGEPVDFTDAYEPPTLRRLAERGAAADLAVDFLEMQPVVETASDLASALAVLEARSAAERSGPVHTTEYLSELGVRLADGEPELVRE